MAVAMGAAGEVREPLIALARHENAAVRKEAVAALGYATGSGVLAALEFAAGDTNRSVADAARQSLARHTFSDANPINMAAAGEPDP
jgi:hypothetical protein